MKRIELPIQNIIDYYASGTSAQDIAQQFNVDHKVILRRLRENGVSIRKSTMAASMKNRNRGVCHNYFETIDSEKKAYFLGLITADGCIYVPKKIKSQKQLHIQLKNNDRYILEEFKKELKLTGQTINEYLNCSKLCICSDKICNDLSKYGVLERKTYTLKFPENISHKLFRHYLRGFFDGDGCIHIRKYRGFCISFTSSSLEYLEKMKKYLCKNYGIESNRKIQNFDTYSVLYYGDLKSFGGLYDIFYTNSSIFFKRKKNKFERIKKCLKKE
jgi:intein-encoded DNA endonuclease-like protein